MSIHAFKKFVPISATALRKILIKVVRVKDILLIGGAGFLGRHLAATLAAQEWNVGVLDRIPSGANGVTDFVGDLRDTSVIRPALARFPNVVYLAHESRSTPSADRLPANFISNIELFLTVLGEATDFQLESFTLFSSGGAVYGEAQSPLIAESHPKNPCSPYGIAKLTMEKYLAMTAFAHGFRGLSIRPSNPYGPGQNIAGAQGIIAVAMARIARGQPITIRGDGSAIKDYIFINDFCEGCACLISNPAAAGPFNVGSGQGIKLIDLLNEIEGLVGRKAKLEFQPADPGDVTANVLDISKITMAAGWQPQTSLKSGLSKTWAWIKSQIG